jgi:hypothetical protein
MTSVRKDILIRARPERVWAAGRDVGAVHRLVPGVLVDTRLDGDARIVTFANGLALRELIVDIDDEARRFVYASIRGRATHHNASMQVFVDSERRSRPLLDHRRVAERPRAVYSRPGGAGGSRNEANAGVLEGE